MIRERRSLSLLSLGASLLWAIPANAVAPPAVFKDANGNVYVHSGVTAGARVEVSLVGVPLLRRIRAGYCGQITLSPSTSLASLGDSVSINGTTINLTTIATDTTPPRCVGNAFEPATTTGFKESSGRVVIPGYTAGVIYNVRFNDVPSSANTTVNGCNFATIRNTSTRPLPGQIKINGMSYIVSTLTTASPPLCRRDAATGVSTKYIPSSW